MFKENNVCWSGISFPLLSYIGSSSKDSLFFIFRMSPTIRGLLWSVQQFTFLVHLQCFAVVVALHAYHSQYDGICSKFINPWNIEQNTEINFRKCGELLQGYLHALEGCVNTVHSPSVVQMVHVWWTMSRVMVITAAVILVDVSNHEFYWHMYIFLHTSHESIQYCEILTVWMPGYWCTSSISLIRKPIIQSMVNLKTEMRQIHSCCKTIAVGFSLFVIIM